MVDRYEWKAGSLKGSQRAAAPCQEFEARSRGGRQVEQDWVDEVYCVRSAEC